MTVPAWERAKAAIDNGDLDGARLHIYEAVAQWRNLQDYSGNWIASLLAFVGRELGEDNEIQPVEWTDVPVTVEHPPMAPGERCVHHVYKDLAAVPVEIYERIGKSKGK